jgi:pyrimidine operon attenuation protein/uracil phosphoribosyltransferase
MNKKSLILNQKAIAQKLERMVHEVHEKCFNHSKIVLCGIEGNGNEIAERIHNRLKEVSNLNISLCSIKVNKDAPLSEEITCTMDNEAFEDATVIVIDDVSNSGKTLIYAVQYFLQFKTKYIKTLVLVDRNHNRYPIQADFIGTSLSTTLKEHIEVDLNVDEEAVYLI